MSEELKEDLIQLGLQRYVSSLLNAGYDTWEIIADMIESDFDALNIRLGDRRKLQREIARRQFWPENSPLPSCDELREFTLSLQETDAEPLRDGYFPPLSEAMDTEKNSPQLPSSSAREESPMITQNGGPSSVAQTSQSSDTIPSLELDPATTSENRTPKETAPHHLSSVMDTESDDDPTPRATERHAVSPSPV